MKSTNRRRAATLATLLASAALVAGCAPDGASVEPASSSLGASADPRGSAAASGAAGAAPADLSAGFPPSEALATLESSVEVRGRAPKTGYSREEFGPAWADVDGNGCDTRNDVLARDLSSVVLDTDGCVVLSGALLDSYTGDGISFERGVDTSSEVQIDHVVPLSDAWQKGAQQLSADEREALANDPLNLVAVDGPTNSSKGDSDAATWLPPLRSSWCGYASRIVAVKARYDLSVTAAEHDALAGILSGCSDSPDAAPTETPAPSDAPTTSEEVATNVVPPASPTDGSGVSYASCEAVRDAGAAPIREGDPGYSRSLDRDGDGVGCE